tara:strand:- start:3289 stop:4839 length:1551 start_codon:yes stop_codon:yes gene_type:complete
MQNTNKFYYLSLYIILIIFSFLVNFYYSSLGVEPMDSFVLFNGGYKVLNGLTPFKDYWLVTGPLMDYLNAFFFKIFDVSWASYITHSSLTNSLITVLIFTLFNTLGLHKIYNLIYSLMFSLLMYPSVGVPFVDHHATIFVLSAFCLFIFGVKKKNEKYFFFIPSLLIIGFLCKQTPTTYGVFAIAFLGLIYLFNTNNIKNFLLLTIYGSFLSLFILIFFFYLTKIPISNFLTQYIYFAGSIGDDRLSNLKLDFYGIIHEFKFILIPFIYLIFLNIIFYKNKKKDEFIILLSINLFTILMIFHQILTMNENYIFFLIPLLTAFIHNYNINKYTRNIFLYSVIALCLFAVTKYHLRFNEQRKFHRLEKVNLEKAIDAKIIHSKLNGLKWITKTFSEDPSKEIKIILDSIDLLKNENGKFSVITDYLFIPAILNINDYSPNQWYHPRVSYPLKDTKYYKKYKSFFVKKLKINEINKIIIVGNGLENILTSTFSANCFKKTKLSEITFRLEIKKDCGEFG